MATGYTDVAGGPVRPLAARDDDTPSWVQRTLPTPVSNESLSDITCFVVNGCFSVGKGADNARMLLGATGTWLFYDTPEPVGTVASQLRGVHCISGNYWCTAVGVYNVRGGPQLPYAVTDSDSGAWDLRSVPTPGGASAGLNDTFCFLSLACLAVGYYVDAGVLRTFASAWNGSTWSTRTPLNAPGSTNNSLTGVSCPTSSLDCIAAGYASVSGVTQPLMQRWTGFSWTLHTTPLPAGASSGHLLGVSCTVTNPITCMGVGSAGGQAYVVRWGGSGTTWTAEAAPRPAFATSSQFEEVSCTSATACTAVGWFELPSGVRESFAASWNGTAWTTHVTPNPGTRTNVLLGVSCVSSTVCRTAGYASSGGQTFNFAATLN
ncbi:hypothetical protein [Conexibacter woesei]|uniref:Uncharacterized protein n=1 Tax=Conexibacter woesei (strain DSM 14684 / CCUG 47730 / CIP 108061 / JCM 11494 / NBRC 100937 / ID131577) TaxID=469383 RepID=D3EYY0_CONWI|nr:hypothetical protein [Conexibacter woesei]ADB49854.1 hypothetical protein Cwoe_1426 [Conexibacter woesei DSM 14684]